MTVKPISYSEARIWHESRVKHRRIYVDGENQTERPAMVIGQFIHKLMQHPHLPFPKEMRRIRQKYLELGRPDIAERFDRRHEMMVAQIKRQMKPLLLPKREEGLTVKLKCGENLLVKLDGIDYERRRLADYKTYTSAPGSDNYEVWNNAVAGKHKQFSVYALAYEQTYHGYFTEIEIDAIDVAIWPRSSRRRKRVTRILTTRDYNSCRWAEAWLEEAIEGMKRDGIWWKRIDRDKRERSHMDKLF